METIRLNKSANKVNNDQSIPQVFNYKNNRENNAPHSDYIETMTTDKATLSRDPGSTNYYPPTQRQYVNGSSTTTTTFNLFNTEQKAKIKMSKIAPKQGIELNSGENSTRLNGRSSHEKLFKKKNTR